MRNITWVRIEQAVTFRKEGVDWNATDISGENLDKVSPSARKVWIEILSRLHILYWSSSPSARKVWIEIRLQLQISASGVVTFRKEGVDWNVQSRQRRSIRPDRHLPQGRCGLKSLALIAIADNKSHLPQGRCGLKSGSVMPIVPDACHLPQGRCGLK